MPSDNLPSLLSLLRDVYPKVSSDEKACSALISHCIELVSDKSRGFTSIDVKGAVDAFSLTIPNDQDRHTQLFLEASRFRQVLVEHVDPWRPGPTGTQGWGWWAMEMAIKEGDGATLRALIKPGVAPSPQEINNHVFSYDAAGSTNKKVYGNAVALMIQTAALGMRGPRIHEVANELAKMGLDFNLPMGPELGLPLAHARFATIVAALLANGARADTASPDGYALAQAFRGEVARNQVEHLLDVCLTRISEDTSFASQMRAIAPELIHAWGEQLAMCRDGSYKLTPMLNKMHDISIQAGFPLSSKQPGQPSLFGVWASTLLTTGKPGDTNYSHIYRMPLWKEISDSIDMRNLWTGETVVGVPDGAWGLLVAAQNQAFKKGKVLSRDGADAFTGGKAEAFWLSVIELMKLLKDRPAVWNAVLTLRPSIPKSLWPDARLAGFQGYLEIFEAINAMPSCHDEISALTSVASETLKPIAKGVEQLRDPEIINLALRIHISRGMASSVAQAALTKMMTDHPQHLDVSALLVTLERAQSSMSREMAAGITASLMNIHVAPTTVQVRPGPRL